MFAEDGEPCTEGSEEGICCFSVETSICRVDAACCTADQCDSGEGCCDFQCLDIQNDFSNCGGCGDACPPTKADACTNGECTCAGGPGCRPRSACAA